MVKLKCQSSRVFKTYNEGHDNFRIMCKLNEIFVLMKLLLFPVVDLEPIKNIQQVCSPIDQKKH